MCDSLISAIPSLLGALIGGIFAYLGVNKQLKFEMEKIGKQKEEEKSIAIAIIKAFLIDEIKYNYNEIKDNGGNFLGILKMEIEGEHRGLGNYKFVFDEYSAMKYEMIKHKSNTIIDVIDIYKTFEFLKINKQKKYGDLSESERQFLKDGILKCEEMIG